ncbi:MAG: GNAT family N-acetyltransferase [Pseudomonadota bacterium]
MMKDIANQFRIARADEGAILAELIEAASEGLALYTWTKDAAPSEDPWVRGADRQGKAAAEGKWIVAIEGDAPVAGLRGERLPDEPEPIPEDFEPLFRPLQELENAAPGTWYVHVLATRAHHRGEGWGTKLLTLAEEIALGMGCKTLSIIVADNNTGARRLYERFGFEEAERRAMVKGEWESEGTDWVLMLKPIGAR